MKIDSSIGYIFSKYELMYVMCAMGARYFLDENTETSLSSEELAEKAEQELIRKNYVFKDFSDNLVLNKELTEYFKPIVSPEKVISCKSIKDGVHSRFMLYMKGEMVVSVETNKSNKDYILACGSEKINDVFAFCRFDECGAKSTNNKFIIETKKYKLMSNMLRENDETAFELMLSEYDIKKELYKEMKSVFLNEGDILALSLCSDCKYDKMDYLIYIATDAYIWAIIPDCYGGKTVRVSSVMQEDITNKIVDLLAARFNFKTNDFWQDKF